MARAPRSFSVVPNHSVHKMWRGHNRENNLGTDEQKQKYIDLLNRELESKKYEKGAIPQAITLMSNHAHEMFLILVQTLFSNLMRRHHSLYGRFFNDLFDRCGKVAQDRPLTVLIEGDYHEMQAVFYIHANPVKAKMVKDARDYYWSTHKLYAFGKRDPWMRNIELPPWYIRLGRNATLRQKAYRRLFEKYLKESVLKKKLFTQRLFFGSQAWVKERLKEVKRWRAEHAPP